MSHNRQNAYTTIIHQDAEGLRKMRCMPSFSRLRQFIEFLLGQYSVILVDDRGKYEIGLDLVWKISDPSIKFHIGSNICYLLSHTYLKLTLTMNSLKQFLKCNTKELKMSQHYNR